MKFPLNNTRHCGGPPGHARRFWNLTQTLPPNPTIEPAIASAASGWRCRPKRPSVRGSAGVPPARAGSSRWLGEVRTPSDRGERTARLCTQQALAAVLRVRDFAKLEARKVTRRQTRMPLMAAAPRGSRRIRVWRRSQGLRQSEKGEADSDASDASGQ